jgi:predicted O-linked N-acetylglucosamine transferase (SPINDLY family)
MLDRSADAALVAHGSDLLGLRRDAEALGCFERVAEASPLAPQSRRGRCLALARLGRADAALQILDDWRLAEPSRGDLDGLHAQILVVKGRKEQAWEAARRGWERKPPDPLALLVRGLLLLERGESSAALPAFDAALALEPALASAHQGRGGALIVEGRVEEGLAALESARGLDPNNPTLLLRIGRAIIQMNRFDQAAEVFETALTQRPRDVEALRGRAQCLAALGEAPRALAAYSRLLEVAPGDDYMQGERFHVQMHCCDWRDFAARQSELVEGVRRRARVDNPGSFMAHADSPADQLTCARTYAEDIRVFERGRWPPQHRAPGSRLRVAYLSADFGAHATAYLAAGLFEAHDRARFETHALSFGPDDGSDMRGRLTRAFDRFEDVRHLTDAQIAARVNELGIDIAVDLKGHTLGARPRIFAHRPAAVQVSFLGYPGTLGCDFMDYIIADRTVIPEEARAWYTENIIYMPGCYQVNDSARCANLSPTRHAAGLPVSGFVFCCFNSSYKITPEVFVDWMHILRAVPGSVLWLLEGSATAAANLRAAAQRLGVDADRLVFAPWVSVPDHLARCALADVFLDTRPYNAHTTASDALWAGVPVVTWPGESFPSRVATSLLRAVGLEQLSVGSSEEYKHLAIRLAESPEELGGLKRALVLARHKASLFDTARYCRHLERAFEEIVARSRRGEAPTDLELIETHR